MTGDKPIIDVLVLGHRHSNVPTATVRVSLADGRWLELRIDRDDSNTQKAGVVVIAHCDASLQGVLRHSFQSLFEACVVDGATSDTPPAPPPQAAGS